MPKRRCARCPQLVAATVYRGLCDSCRKQRDAARGSRADRGYGTEHQKLGRDMQAQVDRGELVICCLCHKPIVRGQRVVPDHNADRTGYRGPAHERCNLIEAGRASHRSGTD